MGFRARNVQYGLLSFQTRISPADSGSSGGGIFRSNAFGFPRESVLKGRREEKEKKWTHQIWMNGSKFTKKRGGTRQGKRFNRNIAQGNTLFHNHKKARGIVLCSLP